MWSDGPAGAGLREEVIDPMTAETTGAQSARTGSRMTLSHTTAVDSTTADASEGHSWPLVVRGGVPLRSSRVIPGAPLTDQPIPGRPPEVQYLLGLDAGEDSVEPITFDARPMRHRTSGADQGLEPGIEQVRFRR